MAFMAWSQGSRQIHYCLNGHLAEPARLAAIPIAYYVKGCADVPLGHRLLPPRDRAWVFQGNLGRLCVHCPNHALLGEWRGPPVEGTAYRYCRLSFCFQFPPYGQGRAAIIGGMGCYRQKSGFGEVLNHHFPENFALLWPTLAGRAPNRDASELAWC